MRKLIVWFVALPLAALAFLLALGSVTKLRNPDVAMAIWPTPGLTYEREAEAAFGARLGEELAQIESVYRAPDGALAMRAFRNEPTAFFSLGLLSLAASANGDTQRAREMFEIVSALDKRQSLANLWLLFDYGRSDRLGAMLGAADRLFRANVQARDRIMPGLAQATSVEGAVPAIEAQLADDPPWSFQYWWALVRQPAAFDNAAILRERAAARGLAVPDGFDRAFLFALAEAGKLERAQQLAATLTKTEPTRATRDATLEFDFTDEAGLPPFAWDVLSEGDFGGYLEPQLGEIGISAVARSGGVVARRLVQFAPGSYAMTVTARLGGTSEPPVSVVVRCATRTRPQIGAVELTERNTETTFAVPGSACEYGWIEIEAERVDDPEGYDVAIEAIRIAPANRR